MDQHLKNKTKEKSIANCGGRSLERSLIQNWTKLNKTAYAEGTADQNKNGSLVSSLDSHLLSKMAADDCFLSRKMSRIQSRLVELILSGMRKDIGRH